MFPERRTVTVFVLALLIFGSSSPGASQQASLVRILRDPVIWKADFAAVLAFSPSWARIGERQVFVFSDRVAGRTAFKERAKAEEQASTLRRAEREAMPEPSLDFVNIVQPFLRLAPPFRTAVVTLPDDELLHSAWVGRRSQFFGTQLTLAQVRQRFGPPERVTEEIVPSEKDRRPVVLTLYHYAGGTVKFAEWNLSRKRGEVNRVILDVSAVVAIVFRRPR